MSIAPTSAVSTAAIPADVRRGGADARRAWDTAVSFERVLLGQLTKELSAASPGMAGDSPYASMMPEALADSLSQSGGMGLARGIYDAIHPATPAAGSPTGGVSA